MYREPSVGICTFTLGTGSGESLHCTESAQADVCARRQRGLFNVLHATGLLCSSCGYCQGMGSVAATFLCYLPPESAYAAMVTLHDVYGLHRVYEPGFPGMLQCFAAQEALTRAIMPDVAAIFDASFISVSSFATKWYITLFATTVAFSTQLRIWDLFLLEGMDVLVITATAVIWVLKRECSQLSPTVR